jgi:hypothetical protein
MKPSKWEKEIITHVWKSLHFCRTCLGVGRIPLRGPVEHTEGGFHGGSYVCPTCNGTGERESWRK